MSNSRSEGIITVRYAGQAFRLKLALDDSMKTVLDSLHRVCSLTPTTQLFFLSTLVDPLSPISSYPFEADFDAGELRVLEAKSQFGFSVQMKVFSKARVKDVRRIVSNRLGIKTTELELTHEDSVCGDEEMIEGLENETFQFFLSPENTMIFIIHEKVLKFTLAMGSNTSADTILRHISSEENLPMDNLVLISNGKRIENQLPSLVRNALFVYYTLANPAAIHVIIRTFDGGYITLDADATTTVSDVKAKVAVHTSRSIERIGLVYNGKAMHNDATLLSLNVRNSSVLWCYSSSTQQKVLVRGPSWLQTLDVSPIDSVATAKALLQTLRKIPVSQQVILFGAMTLDDNETVSSLCFHSQTALKCLFLPAVYIRSLYGKLTKFVPRPGCSIADMKSDLVRTGILQSSRTSFTYGIQTLRDEVVLSDLGLIDKSILDGDFL